MVLALANLDLVCLLLHFLLIYLFIGLTKILSLQVKWSNRLPTSATYMASQLALTYTDGIDFLTKDAQHPETKEFDPRNWGHKFNAARIYGALGFEMHHCLPWLSTQSSPFSFFFPFL